MLGDRLFFERLLVGSVLRLSYRSSELLRVVGEVEDWVGHTPGQLEAMKEGIARLDAEGAANIID